MVAAWWAVTPRGKRRQRTQVEGEKKEQHDAGLWQLREYSIGFPDSHTAVIGFRRLEVGIWKA